MLNRVAVKCYFFSFLLPLQAIISVQKKDKRLYSKYSRTVNTDDDKRKWTVAIYQTFEST